MKFVILFISLIVLLTAGLVTADFEDLDVATCSASGCSVTEWNTNNTNTASAIGKNIADTLTWTDTSALGASDTIVNVSFHYRWSGAANLDGDIDLTFNGVASECIFQITENANADNWNVVDISSCGGSPWTKADLDAMGLIVRNSDAAGGATLTNHYGTVIIGFTPLVDVSPPFGLKVMPINNTITNNRSTVFQVNATDDAALANQTFYFWNYTTGGQLYTYTQNITGISKYVNLTYNFTIDGNYTWSVLIADGMGNLNWSNNATDTNLQQNWTVTIDSRAPQWNAYKNITTYHNQSISYTINTTDNYLGVQCHGVNDSNFDMYCNGTLVNITSLSTKIYIVNLSVNDTIGNTNSTLIWIDVIGEVVEKASNISFIDPTPANASTQPETSIFVNISSNSTLEHYAFMDFDRDLLLWMRMDDVDGGGDPVDISSYSTNGTLEGNAVINSTGRFGDGAHFDGTLDFINLSQQVADVPQITISTWIVLSSTTNEIRIIEKNDNPFGGGLHYFMLSNFNNAQSIRFRIAAGGTTTTLVTASGTIPQNKWVHVAATYDETTMKIYLNGTIFAQAVHDVGGAIDACPACDTLIGAAASDAFGGWTGAIDEVMLFSRALNDTEVSALYNASVNQSYHNFTDLDSKDYNFTGYIVDTDGDLNSTGIRIVTIGADSCGYTSGDWVVDCSDNCDITGDVDVGGNNIFITGTGFFHVTNAFIRNFGRLWIQGTDVNNICSVTATNGGFTT